VAVAAGAALAACDCLLLGGGGAGLSAWDGEEGERGRGRQHCDLLCLWGGGVGDWGGGVWHCARWEYVLCVSVCSLEGPASGTVLLAW